MIETPDKVFTLADDLNTPVLLFTNLLNPENTPQDIQTIFHIFPKYFETTYVYPKLQHQSRHRWYNKRYKSAYRSYQLKQQATQITQDPYTYKATCELENGIVALLDKAPDNCFLYIVKEGSVQHINLQEVYYSCLLPHRQLVGCIECVKEMEDTPKDCVIKKALKQDAATSHIETEDLLDQFQNRKTMLGPFTYISPRLTSTEYFQKTLRDEDEHDFKMIEDNSAMITQGLHERQRVKLFRKTYCSNCFINSVCYHSSYCSGTYDKTSGDATATILSQVHIPYTDDQLSYLLAHCGELPKRVNNRVGYLTFCVGSQEQYYNQIVPDKRELMMCVTHRRHPDSLLLVLPTFDDATSFIKTHYKHDHAPLWEPGTPIPVEYKALLIEAVTHRRWDRYPGITCNRSSITLEGISRWNRQLSPYYSENMQTLLDYYTRFKSFHWLTQKEANQYCRGHYPKQS